MMLTDRIEFRRAARADIPAAAALADRLWSPSGERETEFERMLASEDSEIFMAYAGGKAVGFAQCGLRRDYVEGKDGEGPVGYLEGIYVEPEYRRGGIARMLVMQCEDWARAKGLSEFASDTPLNNEEGLRFHLGSGFEEAGRVICFIKQL